MSAVNKKPYINISQLIDNYHSNKKHSLEITRPTSQQTNYDRPSAHKENRSSRINVENKVKEGKINKRVCIKLDLENDFSTANQTQREHKQPVGCLMKERPSVDVGGSEVKQQFKYFQKLITSNRMFINPDKWQSFLQSCKSDAKFHKALSSFLYSYFIENYQ